MKYIFRSSIDIDRDTWRPGKPGRVTPEWVEYRLELFHKYTLPSVLNQTEQDFELWVLCGQCYKKITSCYNWHPRVKVIYNYKDFLRSYLAKSEEDYLTIGRVDSDDMYHKNALKVIKENQIKNPNELTGMAFRAVYSWDRYSNVIFKYYQGHPPQYIHTIPKKRYKDYDYFMKHHMTKHVGGSHNAIALPSYHFCETRHSQSWTARKKCSWSKIYKHAVLSKETKLRGLRSGKFLAIDKEGLHNILKDFGIKKDDI